MPPLSKSIAVLGCLAAAGALGACASTGSGGADAHYRAANLRPYEVNGQRYTPQAFSRYDAKGVASWYSYPSHTRRTATGEWYDPGQFTGAHKTLPLPCEVEVTNLANGRKVKVRINDRGPFADGRIIDLSRAAAERLGFTREGVARVRVRLLGPAAVADSGEIELAEAAPVNAEGAQLY